MREIRVGIIGQGRSGQNIHGVYLAKDARFKVVAVSDEIASRRASGERRHGATSYADHRELLARDDLDLVVNATFSHRHAPVTRDALLAGHNVLCEKPFARTVAEVDELITIAEERKLLLAIFQQSRYASYFRQVRRVIDSGVLGRIVQISICFNGHSRRWDWQTLQEYNGGNLANTGPHPLDQALVLFGDGQPEVFCRMDRTEATTGDAENHVKMILSGAGHPLVDLEISSCCAYPAFTYQIYGTRGGMRSTTTEATWRYYDPARLPALVLHREPLVDAAGEPIYCGEKIDWQTGSWPETEAADKKGDGGSYVPFTPGTNMTQDFYGMLYNSLTTGAPLEITPQQVRRQIAVIEECRRQNPDIYR